MTWKGEWSSRNLTKLPATPQATSAGRAAKEALLMELNHGNLTHDRPKKNWEIDRGLMDKRGGYCNYPARIPMIELQPA